MDLGNKIQSILSKYPQLTIAEVAEAAKEILIEADKVIKAKVKAETGYRIASLPVEDLEEFLTMARELQAKYENLTEKTTTDIIRLDELKQLEFKLTELILTNR